MKLYEQIIKQKTAPNTIQILWTIKNQEKANNSPSYPCAAFKKIETSQVTTFVKRDNFLHFSQSDGNFT